MTPDWKQTLTFVSSKPFHSMKNIFQQAVILIVSLFSAGLVEAQTINYKPLIDEIQQLQKQFVPDSRVAIFNVDLKDTLQFPLILTGKTDLPDARSQLLQLLKAKNIPFVDSLILLPSVSLGSQTWALASLSVSTLRSKPDDAAELVTQVMMGTPMKVLEQSKNWFRVQTPEHYIGWIDGSGLQRFTLEELNQWKESNRFMLNKLSGYVYDKPSKKASVVTDLVLGDLFEAGKSKRGYLKISLPDGRKGFVKRSDCISYSDWVGSQPDIEALLDFASQMMGSPYLWGGTSAKAVDCSGFVKLLYYSQAVILARDASQQARYGEVIDHTNVNILQRGDLLFFASSAKRISHTGVYLGKGDFIHASGRVLISSIDPLDAKYLPSRNYVAARRVITAIDTEGITPVKNHPWYNRIK